MELPALAQAEKAIAVVPRWSQPDDDDGYIHFQVPLEIGGVTEAGLFLNGGTYKGLPDRHVTFEMFLLISGGFKQLKLMRVDWRSLRGGHTNLRRYDCPPECRRRASESHFHAFDINWLETQGRMRGYRLPCARDIPGA
jgi:hypothetical protein